MALSKTVSSWNPWTIPSLCPFHKAAPASKKASRIQTHASVMDRGASVEAPVVLNSELIRMHSAPKEALECIDSMQGYFEGNILPLLTPVQDLWQPADLLPDPSSESFLHDINELRARTVNLPDELLVCLVGDMITEEALPTYMAMLNTLDGIRDETGRSQTPYAKWTRQWIAEENRHGDLLNKYLWLTGRVNLAAVERTIQRLISAGMDPKTENNPYLCFVFTSFQERATKISHGSTARIAKAYGDETLAKVCGVIAADESRHEVAYTRTMDAIFKSDPSNAMISFADMMRKTIVMPAHFMDDGLHGSSLNPGRNLFHDFSAVAEDLGVYTAMDYVKIMEHLIQRWNISQITGLTDEAAEARDYLCSLPERFRRLAERREKKKASTKQPRAEVAFSWLYDRKLSLSS